MTDFDDHNSKLRKNHQPGKDPAMNRMLLPDHLGTEAGCRIERSFRERCLESFVLGESWIFADRRPSRASRFQALFFSAKPSMSTTSAISG